jgi:Domain of unknown function (DUF1707)
LSNEPASYLTLEKGTRVVDRFGAPVGRVERVLTFADSFFDGLIVSTRAGSRFVDAPEVRRIETDVVELSITCADCEAPTMGKHDGVPAARWDRTEVTDADRREAIEALKAAYVNDRMTAHELSDRVEAVYRATSFAALDQLLAE